MLSSSLPAITAPTVDAQRRQQRMTALWVFAACAVGYLLVAVLAVRSADRPFSLALLILLMGLAVAVARPVAGIYLLVFFSMLGDQVISGWYPFNKNLSSF